MSCKWIVWLLCSGICLAQAIPARAKPEDYPVQASVPTFTLAAEFQAHTLPTGKTPFFAADFLIVEVAIYPMAKPVTVDNGFFRLRLNGKTILLPQSSGMVVANIKRTDLKMRPAVVASGGIGDSQIQLGGQRKQPRFPGDPTGLPPTTQPRAPEQEKTGGIAIVEEAPPEEVVPAKALETGVISKPAGGLLYFAFEGKLKSLKTVELLYRGPDGECSLKLR